MEKLEKIRKAYTDYVLENGTPPPSVFQFAKKLKISEADFYQEYTSFESIEADIWLTFFKQALQNIETDPIYQTYSVREKLLAFYYTWIEVLKSQRSFAVFSYNRIRQSQVQASPMAKARMGTQSSRILQPFKESYYDFVRDLLAEGRESKEVEPRPLLSDRYADGLWTQTLFILHFWINDVSKNFEKTDTAIEKSVNTAFDLIGRSPLDSLFDLAKFIFQNK
ncbi:TetR family transcriptional regulator C-terminal domain-containing protein [Larkinella terrae]|uniref:TetR/AcrR family transcriptional regulator n=1 Tax=Larkinella terrae TaxID=2025311 RepID=A0A7K0EMG4_9BACT|nr:TetR family transcriptional regulator C-terminal domain-containing protein [Larkinella terrae]MRS62676.1 TetR/AcrR family transcriptional regulator [Larkinella terrae]